MMKPTTYSLVFVKQLSTGQDSFSSFVWTQCFKHGNYRTNSKVEVTLTRGARRPCVWLYSGVWTPRVRGRSEAFTRKECLYPSSSDKALPSIEGQDFLVHTAPPFLPLPHHRKTKGDGTPCIHIWIFLVKQNNLYSNPKVGFKQDDKWEAVYCAQTDLCDWPHSNLTCTVMMNV